MFFIETIGDLNSPVVRSRGELGLAIFPTKNWGSRATNLIVSPSDCPVGTANAPEPGRVFFPRLVFGEEHVTKSKGAFWALGCRREGAAYTVPLDT